MDKLFNFFLVMKSHTSGKLVITNHHKCYYMDFTVVFGSLCLDFKS